MTEDIYESKLSDAILEIVFHFIDRTRLLFKSM